MKSRYRATLTVATIAYAACAASWADDYSKEEVIITGSMLPQAQTQPNPMANTYSAEQIRDSGATSASDFIRSLPADNSGSLSTAFVGGFATGGSGVSLRGLTVNSTLVLIDGRRAAPYALSDDGQRSFVDLNTLPLDAVDRIEVLKDGASSLYGADAIAGVVNVVLKKQYQGAELNVEGGRGQHAGGSTRRVTGSIGFGDLDVDRYNGYLNFEFRGDDRILAVDRSFPFNTKDLSSIGGFDARNGTPGSFTGTTAAIVAPAVLPAGASTPDILNTIQVGAYRPLTSCTGIGNTSATAPSAITGATDSFCLQNKASYTDVQPGQKRIGVSGRLTLKVADMTELYFNESYYQNNTQADFRPIPLQDIIPVNTENIALPPRLSNGQLNPNDPFAAAGTYALIQYAFGDIPSFTQIENHDSRTVAGVKGKWGGWNFDSALVIDHTWLYQTQAGLLNTTALLTAIADGTYDFVDPSRNSPSERAVLSPNLSVTATTDLDSIDLRVRRRAVNLPGGPLELAMGAEARYEAQSLPQVSPNTQVQGLGALRIVGCRNVTAGYLELGVPIVRALSVDLSGRFDHYSDFGNALTPKIGIQFAPVTVLTLNGTWSRGFRAPAIAEIGSSAVENFFPLTPTAGSPFPSNFCNPSYHSAAYCQQYFVGSFNSGNPNLRPERSDSFTFAAAWRPATQFSLSADFYAIRKRDVIEPPNTTPALAAYLNGAPVPAGYTVTPDLPDAAFPGSLSRPLLASGLYVNENALRTDGIDIDLHAQLDFQGIGRWTSDLSATKIFSYKIEFPDGSSEQFAGTQGPYNLSAGAGTPRYKASWSNGYSLGRLSTTLTAYYVSGFREVGVDATGDPNACLYNDTYCHVASFINLVVTGIYHLDEHMTTSFAVHNLMDRRPPLDPASFSGLNYNPTYHQAGMIGRYFELGVGYRF